MSKKIYSKSGFLSLSIAIIAVLFAGTAKIQAANSNMAAPDVILTQQANSGTSTQIPNLAGNWILTIDHNSNIQFHDMSIVSQDENGNLTGIGGYPHKSDAYSITWKIQKGQIGTNGISLTIAYDNADYVNKLKGNLQPDGLMVGTWKDNRGLSGKWSAIRSN